MKKQRGVALSGLMFWGVILVLVAVLGMKAVPSYIEYYKTLKDAKATVAKVGPEATVAEVRNAYDRFVDIDSLSIKAADLDISKNNGKVVIEFAYEKRLPLFMNVSLLIDFKGSTAE